MTVTIRPCSVEPLEGRQLLSAATLAGGVLKIEGTRRADVIDVASAQLGRNARAGLRITVNKETFYFRLKGIARVEIVTGDGDDRITTAAALVLPTSVRAGDGNDTIYGSAANDTLDGGPADDLIYGLGGDDVLLGGAGNDSLRGNNGADALNGGAGDDDLAGESNYLNRMPTWDPRSEVDYIDSLFGGTGSDTFYAHDGKDQIKDATRHERRIDPTIAM